MSEMECLNMDETPLEDWSKEDLIREMRRRENAFGKILDECDVTRRRGESSADALRRRLSPTAQPQPEFEALIAEAGVPDETEGEKNES